MDLDLPPEDDPRRAAVRSWRAAHPRPSMAELAAAGYLMCHWPEPWGLGADPEHQLIIDEELGDTLGPPESSAIALGWAGPTILAGGTVEQQQRWLPGILDGSTSWTQLFSEPDAGSDLASLRTRAIRDGDHYLVTGQKIWSTWADRADWGILLARTDSHAQPHRGISYFCVDMTLPGLQVRPITEMTGGQHFCETYLDEVPVPVDARIGEEGDGWRLARVTLGAERLSLSQGGVLWGMGPTAQQCFEELHRLGPCDAPPLRQRTARAWTHAEIIRLLGLRMLSSALVGDDPSDFASIRKCLTDEFGQEIMSLVVDRRSGPAGRDARISQCQADACAAPDVFDWGFLFSRALTIGGGTSEVQRNIIAERLLGLPRETLVRTHERAPVGSAAQATDQSS